MADFPIFKLSERVFRLEDFNYENNLDSEFINEFCGILDLGLKFVPSVFYNLNNFFLYYLFELDKSFTKLNSYIFFEKQKEKNEKNTTKKTKKDFSIVETILKSMRNSISNKINHTNIPLQDETLVLRNNLFKVMANAKNFKHLNNLNKNQISCIKKFLKEKPFMLTNSDKNVGWVCLNKSLYIKLSKEHLFSNNNIYKQLEYDPLEVTIRRITISLNNLLNNGHISKRLHKQLLPKNTCNLGKFRILPKLHKDKFGIRPIINNINHPTVSLSHFVDLFLQPFVRNTESFIKDSQNLLQICQNIEINKNSKLYSCDFESLYTNINSEDAIQLITEYFSQKISLYSYDFNIYGFNEILKLTLYNNIFTFDDLYFIQINGLSMGGKCGPSVANIYIYIKEIMWVKYNKPTIYKRFIDDIFVVSNYDIINSNFKDIFGNLKLNITSNDEVQFLDLLISKDKYHDKLLFKLYTKPTNTFQYLFYSSNHPLHIFNNIPKSLFIRLKRICSYYYDYLFFSRKLISQLLKRGYNFISLMKICLTIGNENRDSLICYKDKSINTNKYNTVFKFIINYDLNYIDLKKDFNSETIKLKNDYNWLNNFNFSLLNSSTYNLNSIFINNCKINVKNNFFETKNCKNFNCKICNFILDIRFLKTFNGFSIPILCNANCTSTNVVYILTCCKCNVYYVGQTKRKFSLRFK